MSNLNYDPDEVVAIIGMAGRFPGAQSVAEFWQNLCDGVESITFFTEQQLEDAGVDPAELKHPSYVRARGVLEGIEEFDAPFFGFSPREAEITDPQQRLFLTCAWESLEDAGYEPSIFPGRIGVFAGLSLNTYFLSNIYPNRELIELVGERQIVMGNDRDYLATRVSYKLNLKGPSLTVQTACSTSLVAVHLACQSLLGYQSDMALAGGVSATVPQKTGYFFREGGITSPDGHCRAFDAKAQGTVSGSGVGIVVLKRLGEALAARDHIYAIIRGSAINNDGAAKIGYTAPGINGQAEVIAEAQAMAEVDPEHVTYIETHGTGTTLGDPIELRALRRVFCASTTKKNFCAIGSVKTNVGHLDAAAGVASLIKTALALKHQLIPPSLHFEQPNPQIDFLESPFYVNTKLSDWQTDGTPRVAGVSSFGIGGTNAHVVLEEAPAVEASFSSRPYQLLLLSARTSTALETATKRLAEYMKRHRELPLADVAYTLQVGRKVFNHRRALVCESQDAAAESLERLDSPQLFTGVQEEGERTVVFMFPGQGAQYVNMGLELYQTESSFREKLDLCAELLKPSLGLDLRDVLYPGEINDDSTHQLQQTSLAQPALFAVEYAIAHLWLKCGLRPAAMIGHSIGEYVAACLANVLSLEDALSLVAARGRLMQQLSAGLMLSVSLSEHEIQPWLFAGLSLAAVNGPSHCVVSGPLEFVGQLEQMLVANGVTCRRLKTSHAFHSAMMDPILKPFAEELSEIRFNAPLIPYVSNVTGNWVTDDEVQDPAYWVRHLRQTVRFADGISMLARDPKTVLLEVGPGRTLGTLAQYYLERAAGRVALPSICRREGHVSNESYWLSTLANLWLAGAAIDWSAFHAGERRQRVPLPTYPFEQQSYFIEPPRQSDLPHHVSARLPERAERFYTPLWRQALLPDTPQDLAAQQSCWLILGNECRLDSLLAEKLQQNNQLVLFVKAGEHYAKVDEHTYVINPQRREDYIILFEQLRALRRFPQTIVHFWNVTTAQPERANGAFMEEAQGLSFNSLLFLAQAIGEQHIVDSVHITVVSDNLQSVIGTEEMEPEKATLLGVCKVIAKEYPNLTCGSLDLVVPEPRTWQEEELVDHLLAEVAAKSDSSVVAYRGSHRWVQSFEPVRLQPAVVPPKRLRHKGVYLITGGLGGIGLEVAGYLARTVQARLVLLGRTGLPERVSWQAWLAGHDEQDNLSRRIRKVQALEQLGAEVLIASADIANREAVEAILAEAHERFGNINGIIHAAGIAGGGLIQLQTAETARRVLAPKVAGTQILDLLLKNPAPDFFVLFSSHISLLGGLGRVEYAAANAFLDAFAHARHSKQNVFTVAINWDTWREVGMAADRAAELNLKPEGSLPEGISTVEGIDAFGRILDCDLPQVIVATREFNALAKECNAITAASRLEEMEQARRGQIRHPRAQLSTPYVAPSNEVERTITEIWQELLGIEQIGVDDNFFQLGGDSVISIQVIARSHQAGLNLTPRQVFEYPTISELASVAGLGPIVKAEQGLVTGPVTLTAIQSWFFQQEFAGLQHFNQSALFEVRQALDSELLSKVVAELQAHHDGLRLRFVRDESGWKQINAGLDEIVPFSFKDLSALPETDQRQEIEASAAELQKSLDLSQGPLMRLALCHLGDYQPGRLLIVIHHLVVDGLSWRTLLEDLQTAYQQLSRGERVVLPPKTTSFQHWALRLKELAQSEAMRQELTYWVERLPPQVRPLPVDFPNGDNTFSSVGVVSAALSAEETLALLQEVPQIYHTQISDVLLTALAQAFTNWTAARSLFVDLETHGREPLFDDVDVSRTVGWFTSMFPVLLDLGDTDLPGEELKRVKEQLRGIPNHGIGYGLLRYLTEDDEIASKLAAMPQPEVSFLYMGQFDQVVSENSVFGPADESDGPSRCPQARRTHLLEITGRVAGGCLQMEWRYSWSIHSHTTIEGLADNFLEALRSLISHCRSPGTVGYSPSDFAEFGWTQEDLDNILMRINNSTRAL